MKHPLRSAPAVGHMSKEALRLNPHLAGGIIGAPVTPAPLEKSTTKIKGTKQPNKTEQRMLDICHARVRRGEILNYRYEGMTLRWGRDPKTGAAMRYTGDIVVTTGKRITILEVKGAHIFDRDIVRFKGCRAEWSEFDFEMWQWKDRQWTRIL